MQTRATKFVVVKKGIFPKENKREEKTAKTNNTAITKFLVNRHFGMVELSQQIKFDSGSPPFSVNAVAFRKRNTAAP
jgi:hypothetical protein